MKNLLDAVGRSARVVRYHTENTLHKQTVGEHTYGVMWFVMLLTDFEPSPALVLETLAHDVAEYRTGDMPGDIKAEAHDLGEAMKGVEVEVESKLEYPKRALTAVDRDVIKLADMLEGFAFCLYERKRGNAFIQPILEKYEAWLVRWDSVRVDKIRAHLWEIYK